MNATTTLEYLERINPAALGYDAWVRVGMALKAEGATLDDWQVWSAQDADRYDPDECGRKWNSFNGTGVSAGTLAYLARQGGEPMPAMPPKRKEAPPHQEPAARSGPKAVIAYLRALFQEGERVNVVTEAAQDRRGKWGPRGIGITDMLDEMLPDLVDYGMQVFEMDRAAGAWVRINPLDGAGVKDANVTGFRHVLVESDTLPKNEQLEIIRDLRLPCAAVVDSGGKSIHAIVRVDAGDLEQYRERVSYLYDTLEARGFPVDTANRNPARLSRLPGVMRGEALQELISTRCGAESWDVWVESIESEQAIFQHAPISDAPPAPAPLFSNGPIPAGFGLLIGCDGVGKGWLALDLILSATLGRVMGVRTVSHDGPPLRCCYLSYEDPAPILAWRLTQICEAAGVDPDEWRHRDKSGDLAIFTEPPILFEQKPKAPPSPTPALGALGAFLRRGRYDLCLIDPMASAAMLANENDNAAVNVVACMLRELAADSGCAVILAHHTSKTGAHTGDNHHASRGGSALTGAARWVYQLNEGDRRLGAAVSKNSYAWRVFDISIERSANGPLYEVEGATLAKERELLDEDVYRFVCNCDRDINPRAVKSRASEPARELIGAVNHPPKEVYASVNRLIQEGRLVEETIRKNSKDTPVIRTKKEVDS